MTSPDKPIGVRSTRQRSAISALLDESKGFRSAQDLHAELREGRRDRPDHRARALQSCPTPPWTCEDRFSELIRSARTRHHLCRVCGFTVEVRSPRSRGALRPDGPTVSPRSRIRWAVPLCAECAARRPDFRGGQPRVATGPPARVHRPPVHPGAGADQGG